eukprot:TRINITY_DN4453_c0_g1_i3.p1 TRINITY_DN4453_c0_g1~~TRINITY_DN4453_c0_g1_i3.p1  ORF type:complete len:653 (+),score=206.47 TRINITY_DN4453_c0_g1_i3:240-2198(+)
MTSDIKDSVFRVYEEYVLKDKDLEQGAKGMLPTSDDYQYLKCMDLLTKKGLKLKDEELEYVQKYVQSDMSRKGKKIALRFCMLEYDAAKNKEEKGKVIEKLTKDILKMNFNYPRPGNLDFKAKAKEEVKEKKEEKLLDKVSANEFLEELYKRNMRPLMFSKETLLQADLEKLHKEDFGSLLEVLGRDLPMLDSDKFHELFAKHINEHYDNKSESYESGLYSFIDMITLDQMEKLLKKIPNLANDTVFIVKYIDKKFADSLDAIANRYRSNEEKREKLIELYEYVKNLPPKFADIKSSTLFELLQNGVKVDKYDEGYFIEYLKAPLKPVFVRKKTVSGGYWERVIAKTALNSSGKLGDEALLLAYLEHFFLAGTKMDRFEEYLDSGFLKETWENTMVMAGKEVAMNAQNSARLEKLVSEVRVKIRPDNKECFKTDDPISLKVEIKNVPKLLIKVFEINLENYYRKTMSSFKSDINLDGLVASIERTVEHKEAPQIRHYKDLEFPELKGKVGLYVIELIGNGKSSRAVIKVGSLSVIAHNTSAGQICYILDSDHNICCHDSTGIWMDNTYFKANTDKQGRIAIPYFPSSEGKETQAILLHEGMAQLVDFKRMGERYTLKCGFYLLPESVIMGKTANIVIRPHLTVNGKPPACTC